MNENRKAAPSNASGQQASLLDGWPALLVAVAVIGAAVYAFSPRSQPAFPETRVDAERVLANGIAQQGERIIAVGEQGQVLVADAVDGPWTSAKVEPQRGSTLTRVVFPSKDLAIAVGHDGWILRSTDRGQSWKEVAFAIQTDPLLGVAGPFDGRLFAYGAFGLLMVSDDQGQTWQKRDLNVEEAAGSAPVEADPFADPFAAAGDDPFANFDASAVGGSGHLNAMTQAADGSLILVGERGALLKSIDKGDNWKRLPEVYAGSFFGVLALPSKTLLAFGMRGNVFRSTDHGASWTAAQVPEPNSLFGGVVDAKGNVVLAGAGNTVLRSTDDGATFELAAPLGRIGLADLIALPTGNWLTAGDGGIRLVEPSAATPTGAAS
ncbi:MAG: sialidase [Pseudomonadota bacterium]|nr:sialidase [Pseudomonadota bacterium]